jgi:hypothetical protein
LLRLAVDGNLQDIPVAELAELFDWMVPPSRKYELEMYRNNLRRQAVREADLESPTVREEKKNILRRQVIREARGNSQPKPTELERHQNELRRQAIREALEEKARLKSRTSPKPTVRTGPRGGRYRINSNGRKVYDVP